MEGIRFVARQVEIDYIEAAQGSVVASGRFSTPVESVLEAIRTDGHTRTQAESEVRDGAGTLVATLAVTFDVRQAA